jgi:ankyrin repeat protein
MKAVTGGHQFTVDLLLRRGASVNTFNMFGDTPLSLARQDNDRKMIDILKQNGAQD